MSESAAVSFSPRHIQTRLNPLRPARLSRFRLFAVLGTWMEADIVEATIANARAQGCERVYVVDNGSPDDTVEVARSAGAIVARRFATARYDEELRLQQMNEVVTEASAAEHDDYIWWLFLDADEFPHGPNGSTLLEYLRTLDAKFRIVGARFLDHYPSQAPYYISGRHPLDFQPLCTELSLPMCEAAHRKHPLQRYDRDGAPIECGPGFHHASCVEPLYEPAQPVFLHHFAFREEGPTRRRLELMWTAGQEGETRGVEGRDSHLLARFRSLDAVYGGRWSEVENFLALDPIAEFLVPRPQQFGVDLTSWDALVPPEHRPVLRWYREDANRREELPADPKPPTSAPPALDHGLRDELDLWHEKGLTARFFWRDDDAVAATPELDRLLGLAEQLGVRPAIAVIPGQAEPGLVEALSDADCCVWQHGWNHSDHGRGEFELDRPFQAMIEDALAGQRRMNDLFGHGGWQPVFVPPNHRLAVAFKSLLPALGFNGLSAGLPTTLELDHVREAKAELDLFEWAAGSPLSSATAETELVRLLSSRRTDGRHYEPVGILTHHRAFAEDAWLLTEEIVRLVGSHPAVTFIRPDSFFQPPPSAPAAARARRAEDVTVVVTSCGRHDLLQRTLDSFFSHNTLPVHEVVVMEDGPPIVRSLQDRYRGRHIRWQSTGYQVGQTAAVDRAYGEVATEFVFHCEDDWQFTASGFLEKSFAVLDSNPALLHVGLRAPTDINGHPVTRHTFDADGVPYRLVEHSWDAGVSGIWHGFSFNPGLRRLRDYRALGSFASLDRTGSMRSFEVEREASGTYLELGLVAAVLADNGGLGYVRHIGSTRRVVQMAQAAYAS